MPKNNSGQNLRGSLRQVTVTTCRFNSDSRRMVKDEKIIEQYAQIIAIQASGLEDAIPEQADYDYAKRVLNFVERLFQE